MNPIKFPEHNAIFGEGQPQYEPLPVHITPEGQVISCWQLSEEDKARIAETGQIWLSQITFNRPLQPVFMTTDRSDLFTTAQEPTPSEDETDQI